MSHCNNYLSIFLNGKMQKLAFLIPPKMKRSGVEISRKREEP
jgi:hypothetical protein